MTVRDVYDAGDVLVVGAGAAGALTALRLTKHGYRCALVDMHGFAAGQSNHSHGYMHSGHIYLDASRALIDPLREGSRLWQERLAAAGIAPVTARSTVAFSSSISGQAARRSWQQVELPVLPDAPPACIDDQLLAAAYETAEPSYDFTPMWAKLAAQLRDVPQLRGRLERLRLKGRAVTAAEFVTAGRRGRVALRADAYVIAAGWNIPSLMRGAVSHRGRAVSRMSHMLVVSGRTLPPLSLIVPDHEQYGLFIVSRPRPRGGQVWLISNYLSLAFDGRAALATRLWLTATLRSLVHVAPVLRDPALRWGVYCAPKGELRDVPGEMRSYACESYGLSNLVALAPTKLTLAPLLAEEAADRVSGIVGTSSSRDPAGIFTAARLPVQPERWRAERLVPLDRLCAAHDCPEAADYLSPARLAA